MSLVEYKVGELCSIKHGWAFAGEFFSDEGDYLLLTPGNAYMSGGIKIRPGKEKFYIGEFPKDYLLKKGDILLILTDLVQEAPLLGGSITIPEDNYFLHNQRLGLVENVNTDLVDQRFLYHLFNSPLYRGQVRGSASGATVRHTAPGRIYDCSVSIPQDLATQKNISCLLDSIDELVENNNVITEKLDEILSSTYQEWFINFKFPNHEQVEFFDGIPDGWGIQTIDDVCETVGGGTPSTKIDAYWENGDVEWVTPTDITKLKSLILINPEKKITRLGLEKSSAKLVPPNTILMTSRASIGYFGLIDREVCTNQGFISIIPHNEIMRYYLLLNLKSRVSEIDSLASGATFKEISKSTFRKMPIVLPSDEILEKFDQLVRPIISQMRNLEQQNDQLFKLKETLLPRLMSGELDVSKLSSIE